MMYLVSGSKGSGKTLTATLYAYEAYKKGRVVVSNIKLSFPHERLNKHEIQSIMKQGNLRNCFLLLDEVHTITDSRRSMSKKNVDWSYFFTQSRKLGVDIMATTQRVGQVDVRYRLNTDIFVGCRKVQITPFQFVITQEWEFADTGRTMTLIEAHPEKAFKLYDTDEIVFYKWD